MLASILLSSLSPFLAVRADTTVTSTVTVTVEPSATGRAKHDYNPQISKSFDDTLAQGPPLDMNTTGLVSDLFLRFIVSNGTAPAVCPAPFNASNTAGWTRMIYGLPWQLNEANAPGVSNDSFMITGLQTSRPLNKSEHLFHATHGEGFMRFSNGGGEQCGLNLPWQPSVAQLNKTNCADTYLFSDADDTRCALVTLEGTTLKTNETFNKRDMASDMTSFIETIGDAAMKAAANMTNITLVDESANAALAQGMPYRFPSFNTSSDLWVKFFVNDTLPQECPAAFSAADTTGWTRMTYGIPWQHPNATDNTTSAIMWQLSRDLHGNETLYHASWGAQFMNPEAGAQCGTNYPSDVKKPSAGPLIQCGDVRVPSVPVRCVNVIATA